MKHKRDPVDGIWDLVRGDYYLEAFSFFRLFGFFYLAGKWTSSSGALGGAHYSKGPYDKSAAKLGAKHRCSAGNS